MSRTCELTGLRKQMGRYVPINRSQTGVRTKRSFEPNLQNVTFLSDYIGNISLKLAVKTIRSIEHNGGLDKFLTSRRASELTVAGRKLKKQVLAKILEANPNATKPVARKVNKVGPKRLKAAAKRAAAAK
jgi:large subunit ribosomal protein L28